MVAFLLSCKSSADYSKGKSKTADPEAPGPHPSPPPGRMKNDARSKGPTEMRFSQSLQLSKIQVSEAPVLLEGLRTSARNAEIRGCSTIWPPRRTQGRSTPRRCSGNVWKLQPKPPFSRKRGKLDFPTAARLAGAQHQAAPAGAGNTQHQAKVKLLSTQFLQPSPHPPPISR